jgi:phosphopantothenoylcysteine decarboxylase/phosphopantothenate--cysteine ligase
VANSAPDSLKDRRILLGVSGGIAAYKTPELVRLLRQAGAEVQVVMTRAASQFVTATSLQAVSGRPVRDNLWDPAAEASMGHIELARWADIILIAPATADCLSRLAQGRSDDLLGALCLASRAPLWVAPAMNTVMWQAAATERNVATLIEDGVTVLEPDSGEQACGEFGPGRMQEPLALLNALENHFLQSTQHSQLLKGRRVVITAGPTREPLDPVRYISNHSSGRQGYAFARAARDAGAQVTLISGPVSIAPPAGIELIPVTTALEMYEASLAQASGSDLFVAVAAVADYRPARPADQKIKKAPAAADSEAGMQLSLIENPDIVASVAAMSSRPGVVVGFAAETQNANEHARQKLVRKKLDAIVVNDVSRPDIGFNSSSNAATVIFSDGETQLAKQDKYALSVAVISLVCARFEAQLAHTNPEHVAI